MFLVIHFNDYWKKKAESVHLIRLEMIYESEGAE